MNELSNDQNYIALKAEMQALRAQVDDLNGRLKSLGSAGSVPRRRLFSRVPDFRWLLAAGSLVLVGALVADTASDPAIKVDANGVAINRPILANNSDVNFMGTDHHPAAARLGDKVGQAQIANIVDYKALMIFGRRNSETTDGRIIRMFDWVGIGGKGLSDAPRATLDVRGKVMAESLDVSGPITGASLDVKAGSINGGAITGATINAGESEIYFTGTEHIYKAKGNVLGNAALENSKDFGGLMILGRQAADGQRITRVYDKLGIGGANTATVNAQLDVKGEIRGKLWRSIDYSWTVGQAATKMTKSDHSVCFLTRVSGWFNGSAESVEIKEANGYWTLSGNHTSSGTSKAICIGAPDDSW